MLCITYVTAVGILLGIVGVLIERALPPTAPRRWLWCIIIPLSMFLPGYYRFHHNWSVTDSLVQPAIHAATLDPAINRIWWTTSALLLAWGLANALRVAYLVATSRQRARDQRRPAIVDGVPVVVTDGLGPATVGLLRSRVLVPRWVLALPGLQRRYVLRHEEEHRKAHDAHLLFVASLPLLLMPWNAALWWLIRRLCLAVEMDCDARVIGALGDAHTYGALLLRVAEAGSRGPHLQPAFLGAGMLERRLTQLLSPQPLRRLQRVVVPAVAIALLTLVALVPHPVSGLASHHHPTDASTPALATPEQR